jgi:SAM-dependent methyltransferase
MENALRKHRDRPNFDVKEEIRAYWGKRSETFDLSAGHKIRSEEELDGWAKLVSRYLPPEPQPRVLELAFGTGEFTRTLLALQCRIDALDFSEPMLERARRKHDQQPVRLLLRDAENTQLPEGEYDAVICRHLVWTLTSPESAFADWCRVLKPGGKLIIIDGDWVGKDLLGRLMARIGGLWDRHRPPNGLPSAGAYDHITPHLFFKTGLRPTPLAAMLEGAGFENVRSEPLRGILKAQLTTANWRERLTLVQSARNSFVVTARRPGATKEQS